ncbi:ABC transporter C family member 10 [Hordeum vulgare]|nr:ABC transporter C family member 10 [Hordeum vulgare]
MASSSTTNVGLSDQITQKLTCTNFILWHTQVTPQLRGAGVFDYVDGSMPEPAKVVINKDKDGKEEITPNPFTRSGSGRPTASAMASSSTTNVGLSGQITQKLTRTNFILWRTQVTPQLHGVGVFDYVDGSMPEPAKVVVNKDKDGKEEITPNPLQLIWFQEDQQMSNFDQRVALFQGANYGGGGFKSSASAVVCGCNGVSRYRGSPRDKGKSTGGNNNANTHGDARGNNSNGGGRL